MYSKEQSKIFFKRIYIYNIIFSLLHTYHILRLKLIRFINYIKNFILYRSFSHNCINKKSVVFYLTNTANALHCFPIMCYLEKEGYNILLFHNYNFISKSVFGVKGIFRIKNLQIIKKLENNIIVEMYFYDNLENELKFNSLKKFFLKDIENAKKTDSEIDVPYPMHPIIYDNQIYLKTRSYRNVDRKIKILFSGNTHKETYVINKINEHYKMLNRYDIIEHLRTTLPNEIINIVELRDYIDRIFLGEISYENKLIMIDWQWKIKHGKYDLRIDNNDWLYFLSRADFFLACPGVRIPFCHNIVEAMSVGTIPLTNYGHLFNPPLIDMENCISFDTLECLINKVNLVINMNPDEIQRIRKNVIAYYNQILDMEKFCKKIIDEIKDRNTELILFSEHFNIA